MRYQVQQMNSAFGAHLCGPVVSLRTDDLKVAQREVMARGGVVIDTADEKALLEDGSWMGLEEFGERCNQSFAVQ